MEVLRSDLAAHSLVRRAHSGRRSHRLAARYVLFYLLKRITKKQGGAFYGGLAKHEAAPTRLLLPLLALMTVIPWMPLAPVLVLLLNHAMGLALIACIAWLLVALLDVLQDYISHRHALEVSDNLAARRVRTQVQVLRTSLSLSL